jgi:hypothetical protein
VTIYAPGASPFVYRVFDPAGYVLRLTVTFNNATRAVHDALVEREPGCSYDVILTGVTNEGFPTVVTRSLEVPEGESLIPQTDLHSRGIFDVDDLFRLGITAASTVPAE